MTLCNKLRACLVISSLNLFILWTLSDYIVFIIRLLFCNWQATKPRNIFFTFMRLGTVCMCHKHIARSFAALRRSSVALFKNAAETTSNFPLFLLLATRGTGALLILRWNIYKCKNTRPCVAFEPDSSRKMSEGRQAREKSQLCISFSDTLFDAQLRCVHELGFETKEYKIKR